MDLAQDCGLARQVVERSSQVGDRGRDVVKGSKADDEFASGDDGFCEVAKWFARRVVLASTAFASVVSTV